MNKVSLFLGKPIYQCRYCRSTHGKRCKDDRCLSCGGKGVEYTKFVRRNWEMFENALYSGYLLLEENRR